MRLIVADDSTLLREGVSMVLTDAGFEVTSVGDATALIDAVDRLQPDAVITDIRMPPTFSQEGLEAALAIRHRYPDVAVLVLSQYLEAAYAVRLLEADPLGRVGYLLKDRVTDIPTFIQAVRRVASGETVVDPAVISTLVQRQRVDNPLDRLTQRERDVLALMAEGWSNQGIGERLSLAPKTVETHVGVILAKLGLADSPDENRRVLAVLAFLRGSAQR
jgi:DNA-binding NarL/FixJ family response regulator